jgi:hypothetical protein
MAIIRTLIYWWVWWGKNTFYYYSRPLVWVWWGVKWAIDSHIQRDERRWNEVGTHYWVGGVGWREPGWRWKRLFNPSHPLTKVGKEIIMGRIAEAERTKERTTGNGMYVWQKGGWKIDINSDEFHRHLDKVKAHFEREDREKIERR